MLFAKLCQNTGMNDPFVEQLNLGFLLSVVAVFVWASIDYNRFIKFWMLRPAPYSRRVIIICRVFFALCVLGGAQRLAETVIASRRPAMFYLGALLVAAASFAVLVIMVRSVERMNSRRRKKKIQAQQ